jgi:hypothetical protein
MVSMLTSSAFDHGFKLQHGLIANCKIGIFRFFAALRNASKDRQTHNQDKLPSELAQYKSN